MKGSGRTERRALRTAARITALVAVLAAGGLAAGSASASGTRSALAPPGISLTYLCQFPSGPRPVPVAVTASVPAAGKPGQPIQPTAVGLTMALPPAVVSTLAGLHYETVSAATRLTVSASEGPSGTSVVWPGATRRPVPRPAHGGMTLTTQGTAPSMTASSPGEVILTAASLSMTFTAGRAAVPEPGPARSPTRAEGTPAEGTPARGTPVRGTPAASTPAGGAQTAAPAPAATASPATQVNCTLAAGQHANLADVVVAGGRTARAPQLSAKAKSPCPALPPGGLKLNPRFPPPPPPPGSTVGSAPAPGCAYTTGYADARKLNGAALIQPGLTGVDLFVRTVLNENPKVNYFEADNAAELNYHGQREFPPSTATFLTFGFVPTTATIQLIEHGTINIFAIGPALPSNCKPHQPCDTVATVSARLSVRIVPGSVKVNGAPLAVGSSCETPPFDAILTGTSASKPPYNVVTGGPLDGMVDIPKFSNCGVGENLDPIFNAAISGSRNFNLLTQGPVCFLVGGGGICPPPKPKPLHSVTG
jgi:hypothetical protein